MSSKRQRLILKVLIKETPQTKFLIKQASHNLVPALNGIFTKAKAFNTRKRPYIKSNNF